LDIDLNVHYAAPLKLRLSISTFAAASFAFASLPKASAAMMVTSWMPMKSMMCFK
jgi:hypothetical protein